MQFRLFWFGLIFILLLTFIGCGGEAAQTPTPLPTPTPTPAPASSSPFDGLGQLLQPPQVPGVSEIEKAYAVMQMVSDLLQGKLTPGPDLLFNRSKQSATDLLNNEGIGIFFLDFANPNLGINQFATEVAGNLLALTPLYVIAYVFMLVLSVWQERPIPNPILYAVLVIAVMGFLAAFAVITQGMSEVGRMMAIALSGGDAEFFDRATLLDQVLRVLSNMQQHGGLLSIFSLLVSIVLFLIIMAQLVYRGLALVLLRLLSVLVIPFSVLLEGTQPRAAGRVVAGFFESWFDLVSKVAVFLIILALAAAQAFAEYTWLVLPAGFVLVVLSWKFFSIPFVMVRDAVGRGWGNMMPVAVDSYPAATLPSSAEAARAREIDEARRRMIEE